MMLNSILLSIINKTELDAYKEEIVDLVFSICQRAYNEPYIVNLFFSNVKKLSTKKSERGEYLPLEILLSIMKEMKSNESNISYVQRCFHTFKIVMRTNSKPLDEYIMNESCLIEVVINKLVTLYKSMPETVTKKNKIHFKQAAIKKAKKQVDRKKLKKLKIPGEKIKIKKIKYKNKNQENLGIRNLIQIVYGESFGPLNGDQDISGIQICNFDAFMSFF